MLQLSSFVLDKKLDFVKINVTISLFKCYNCKNE